MPSVWWTSVMFWGMSRQSRSFWMILWESSRSPGSSLWMYIVHSIWKQTTGLPSWWVLKKPFTRSVAVDHPPKAVTVCSSKDTTSGTAASLVQASGSLLYHLPSSIWFLSWPGWWFKWALIGITTLAFLKALWVALNPREDGIDFRVFHLSFPIAVALTLQVEEAMWYS